MAISKKIRFEVFKRDNFMCQYCGRKSPEVVLEIDHIIPLSEGGNDNLENLTTSCFDCNRGKGKELLEMYKDGTDPTEQAILLLERERQLKEYNEVIKEVRNRKNKEFKQLTAYWNKNFNLNSYWFPSGVMRKSLDYIPKEQILEAIDICKLSHQQYDNKKCYGESIRAYFSGILRNMTNNFGKDV